MKPNIVKLTLTDNQDNIGINLNVYEFSYAREKTLSSGFLDRNKRTVTKVEFQNKFNMNDYLVIHVEETPEKVIELINIRSQ